jgi:hypothetical protein
MTPVRIQRKRTRGFNLQEESKRVNGLEVVYVGRPTVFGNNHRLGYCVVCRKEHDRAEAVAEHREEAERAFYKENDLWGLKLMLRGKNLACWCPLDKPCHADVLLELANR